MPQLDPTSFPSQLFWLTVSFVVLYVMLARILLPRVQSVLTLRAGTIGGDLEQASRLKADAENARATYEKALAEARAKSHEMLTRTQAEIAANMAARQAELDAEMLKKLADSQASIAAAKRSAMDKLSPVSGELASLIVEALVQHKPTAKDVGDVITGLAKERAA